MISRTCIVVMTAAMSGPLISLKPPYQPCRLKPVVGSDEMPPLASERIVALVGAELPRQGFDPWDIQVITPMQQQIPDSQFGAGAFEDFPVGNYGATKGSECGKGGSSLPDQPLKLFSVITSDANQVQNAVNQFDTGQGPIGCGLDWPEAMIEALYQISTGEGLSGPGLTNVPANHVGVGGVGFRQGSMPVIIPITDAKDLGENLFNMFSILL